MKSKINDIKLENIYFSSKIPKMGSVMMKSLNFDSNIIKDYET